MRDKKFITLAHTYRIGTCIGLDLCEGGRVISHVIVAPGSTTHGVDD